VRDCREKCPAACQRAVCVVFLAKALDGIDHRAASSTRRAHARERQGNAGTLLERYRCRARRTMARPIFPPRKFATGAAHENCNRSENIVRRNHKRRRVPGGSGQSFSSTNRREKYWTRQGL